MEEGHSQLGMQGKERELARRLSAFCKLKKDGQLSPASTDGLLVPWSRLSRLPEW